MEAKVVLTFHPSLFVSHYMVKLTLKISNFLCCLSWRLASAGTWHSGKTTNQIPCQRNTCFYSLYIMGVYVSCSNDPRTAAFVTHPCFTHILCLPSLPVLPLAHQPFLCDHTLFAQSETRCNPSRDLFWLSLVSGTFQVVPCDLATVRFWQKCTSPPPSGHWTSLLFLQSRVLLAKAWRTGAK